MVDVEVVGVVGSHGGQQEFLCQHVVVLVDGHLLGLQVEMVHTYLFDAAYGTL